MIGDAVACARKLRGSARGFLDIDRLVSELAIGVRSRPFAQDLLGVYVRLPTGNVIGVSTRLDIGFSRLVIAHELGHHFLHPGILHTYRMPFVSTPEEAEAEAFARELLAPAEIIGPMLARANYRIDKSMQLSRTYGVPLQVIILLTAA